LSIIILNNNNNNNNNFKTTRNKRYFVIAHEGCGKALKVINEFAQSTIIVFTIAYLDIIQNVFFALKKIKLQKIYTECVMDLD